MPPMRMTTPRLLTLQALLDDPGRERYGLDLARQAGLQPATVYPVLVAFEAAGWVASREEDLDPHAAGRPRRRYYRLTADGVRAAREAVAARTAAPRRAPGRVAW